MWVLASISMYWVSSLKETKKVFYLYLHMPVMYGQFSLIPMLIDMKIWIYLLDMSVVDHHKTVTNRTIRINISSGRDDWDIRSTSMRIINITNTPGLDHGLYSTPYSVVFLASGYIEFYCKNSKMSTIWHINIWKPLELLLGLLIAPNPYTNWFRFIIRFAGG